MKVALICGHFINGLNYIEESLADDLFNLNHDVRVFTSRIIPPKLNLNNNVSKNYIIQRLPAFMSFGNIVVPRGLPCEIDKFSPDLMVFIGVGKLFHLPLLLRAKKCKIICYFGDNQDYLKWDGFFNKLNSIKNILIKHTIKRIVYSLAFKKCDLIVGYTKSTLSILTSLTIRQKEIVARKYLEISPGYNKDLFYFDEKARCELRSELGLNEKELLFITITRLVPEKLIEKQIDQFRTIHNEGFRFKVLFIGGLNDDYFKRLQNYTQNDVYIKVLPSKNSEEIRRYFSASDFGFWQWASITILQAMGVGLPVILPNRDSVKQLVEVGVNGVLYPEDSFIEKTKELLSLNYSFDRTRVISYNEKYSSQKITESVINRLDLSV